MPAGTSGDTLGIISERAANPGGHISSRWWHESWDEIVRLGYKPHPQCSSRRQLSWLNSDGGYFTLEDEPQSEVVMDAVRVRDGLPVMLKKVLPVESSQELAIHQFFSSSEHAQRSDNHCVPILDVVELQLSESQQLIVFPHLLPFHRSRIRTFEEFIVFITQICEGIQFMHQKNVAYGNCSPGHIMFDPYGRNPDDLSSPSQINQSQNFMGRVKRRFSRTQQRPRYYLTDLSLSQRCTSRHIPNPSLHTGDISIPEHPFCMDIYCLGSLLRENFMQKYQGFEFVRDLVNAMTAADPEQRPTIDQVVERLALANRSLSAIHKRSTFVLRNHEPTRTTRLFHTLWYNLQRRPSTVVP